MISGWKVVAGVKTMYNLEVAQDHTFVVGVGMWVVHNCGPVSPGDAGAYKDLKGVPGDGLTAHHMPGQALAGHFGYTVPTGGAIVMDEDTHALTYNFRYKGIAVTRNIVENEVGFRSALAEPIRDYRKLVPNSNESVRNLIEYWRTTYPDLMSK